MSHIATDETFLVGAPKAETRCMLCCRKSVHRLGWVGSQCGYCKTVWAMDDTMPDLVRKRRQMLKLSYKEMAQLTGYAVASIKKYEFIRCTTPYYELTEQVMMACYQNQTNG